MHEYPYPFEERRPLLCDHLFFLPVYYQKDLPTFSLKERACFAKRQPVHLELCSGNGEWVLKKALQFPLWNWVAVEKKLQRALRIAAKRTMHEIDNLLIVVGDGRDFIKYCLDPETLCAVSINFPDPWPKNRHAKHRLFYGPFSDHLAEAMCVDAELTLVTDHEGYLAEVKNKLSTSGRWELLDKDPVFEEEYGTSYFARLWRLQGRSIHFLHYRKGALQGEQACVYRSSD